MGQEGGATCTIFVIIVVIFFFADNIQFIFAMQYTCTF